MDRQDALTRWALWTCEVSYSQVSGFGICGAVRSSDQGTKYMHTINELPKLISLYALHFKIAPSLRVHTNLCDECSFIQ